MIEVAEPGSSCGLASDLLSSTRKANQICVTNSSELKVQSVHCLAFAMALRALVLAALASRVLSQSRGDVASVYALLVRHRFDKQMMGLALQPPRPVPVAGAGAARLFVALRPKFSLGLPGHYRKGLFRPLRRWLPSRC